MPTACATPSMTISWPQQDKGRATPRNGWPAGLLLTTLMRAAAERADIVAALHVAERQAALDTGGPGPWRVGAGIDHHVAFQAENAAVRVGIGDDLAVVVAAVRVTDEQLVTVLDPAHGTAQLHGRPCHRDRFALDVGLEAEGRADIGGDHAQSPLTDAENLRKPDLQRNRQLMRDIDHELIEPAVVGRNAGATFQRQRVHPVHAEAALDDVSGGGLGSGEIAAFELHVDEDVVAPFLVDEGRAGLERIPHRHDRRQLLELDLHQSRDIFGLRRA